MGSPFSEEPPELSNNPERPYGVTLIKIEPEGRPASWPGKSGGKPPHSKVLRASTEFRDPPRTILLAPGVFLASSGYNGRF